ncbi:MAG: hypothetical protein HEQ25_22160 [Dolichospermum sp. DET73]|nr:hypothetical protein [Dolichospermum sp. DET73]
MRSLIIQQISDRSPIIPTNKRSLIIPTNMRSLIISTNMRSHSPKDCKNSHVHKLLDTYNTD